MIEGFATPEGTTDFARKSLAHNENFRKIQDLILSNVGIGTYLGNPDLETDIQQKNAIKQSILHGVNVIDTAINYRAQKSERTVGKALYGRARINPNWIFTQSQRYHTGFQPGYAFGQE